MLFERDINTIAWELSAKWKIWEEKACSAHERTAERTTFQPAKTGKKPNGASDEITGQKI